MMAEADETIITRIVVDTQSALAEAEKFRQQVDALKAQLQQLSKESGKSFKDVYEGMKRAGPDLSTLKLADPLKGFDTKNWNRALTVAFNESQKAAKNLDTELKSKPKDVAAASSSFSKLGDVARLVFGTILGISAITALRKS